MRDATQAQIEQIRQDSDYWWNLAEADADGAIAGVVGTIIFANPVTWPVVVAGGLQSAVVSSGIYVIVNL